MTLEIHDPYWQPIITEQRTWLRPFDPRYLRNWENLLENHTEAALCEAIIGRWLRSLGFSVEPNESLIGQRSRPDFRCAVNGRHFYVETTCLSIETASLKSGIENKPNRMLTPVNFSALSQAIEAKCKSKTQQLAELDAPSLIAVGTFHSTLPWANRHMVEEVLVGNASIEWQIDLHTRMSVGDAFQTTQLKNAVFMRANGSGEVEDIRHPISGFLLCRLTTEPMDCLGGLHSRSLWSFDRSLMPSVNFCEVDLNHQIGKLWLRWSDA